MTVNDARAERHTSDEGSTVDTDRADNGWEPVRKVRAHEQVLAQFEQRIRNGTLRPGDRLPGERELCEMLQVSRPSLREALRVLEALEIVVPRRGPGGRSGAVIAAEPGEALTSLLRLQIALSRFSMEDVVETRTIVERGAARRAALRASPDDLAAMALLLEAMENTSTSPAEFNQLDTDFHLAVARAGQNKMVAYWMQAIRDAIRQEMAAGFEQLPDWRTTIVELTKEHRGIYEAICEGDGEKAALRVEAHIINFYGEVGTTAPDHTRL